VFTARYALSPYIKQIRFVFKGLISKSKDETYVRWKSENSAILTKQIGAMARLLKSPSHTRQVTREAFLLICINCSVESRASNDAGCLFHVNMHGNCSYYAETY
jgi:hypothetical protein